MTYYELFAFERAKLSIHYYPIFKELCSNCVGSVTLQIAGTINQYLETPLVFSGHLSKIFHLVTSKIDEVEPASGTQIYAVKCFI